MNHYSEINCSKQPHIIIKYLTFWAHFCLTVPKNTLFPYILSHNSLFYHGNKFDVKNKWSVYKSPDNNNPKEHIKIELVTLFAIRCVILRVWELLHSLWKNSKTKSFYSFIFDVKSNKGSHTMCFVVRKETTNSNKLKSLMYKWNRTIKHWCGYEKLAKIHSTSCIY